MARLSIRERQRLCNCRFNFLQDLLVDQPDLFGRLRSHENTVIFEPDHLRLFLIFGTIRFNPVVHHFKENIPGIGILHIKGLFPEKVFHLFFRVYRTKQSIHHRGVQVHHERPFDRVVKGSLHGWALSFCKSSHGQIIFHLLLPLVRVITIRFFSYFVEFFPIQDSKSIQSDRRQSGSTRFYPYFVLVFERSIATTGNHVAIILPIESRYMNQLLQTDIFVKRVAFILIHPLFSFIRLFISSLPSFTNSSRCCLSASPLLSTYPSNPCETTC